MGKTFSTKTHLSGFNKNYDHEKMRRYWNMYGIEIDEGIDDNALIEAALKLRLLAEDRVQILMKKGIPLPK